MAAFDPVKERKLELEWKLNAKRRVLDSALAKRAPSSSVADSAGQATKNGTDETFEYAKTIALFRLEVSDLLDSLQEVEQVPEAPKVKGMEDLEET